MLNDNSSHSHSKSLCSYLEELEAEQLQLAMALSASSVESGGSTTQGVCGEGGEVTGVNQGKRRKRQTR